MGDARRRFAAREGIVRGALNFENERSAAAVSGSDATGRASVIWVRGNCARQACEFGSRVDQLDGVHDDGAVEGHPFVLSIIRGTIFTLSC